MFTMNGVMMGILMATIIGWHILGMSIWSSKMHFIKKISVQILVCGLLFLVCAIGFSGEDKNWNNGYCVECGTKYECIGKSRKTSEYFYSCPNCFHKANH